ncbi:hypothetical protein [Sorangium sp. So ce1024]|uniref:hypothetical protein n=1 Tax=Sorangium sp. So ce1024 TaxID=3133327 RepID=UPI003F0CBA18
MRFELFSQYTTDPRADALEAVTQLRAAVAAKAGLSTLYKGMIIAEAKLRAMGPRFAAAAGRLDSHAPPTLAEIDEMLRALEPVKASCPACEALGGCSLCDGRGVVFDSARAA